MKPITLIGIVLLISCQIGEPQGQSSKVASSGLTRVTATLGKARAEALFRTSVVEVSVSGEERRKFVQCTYSRLPCSLTENVQVLLAGKEVFIPRSAYSDLGDISAAEFGVVNSSIILTIKGGDASEAYIAVLTFNEQRLIERRLYSGEDAKHPLEISHYYQPTTAD